MVLFAAALILAGAHGGTGASNPVVGPELPNLVLEPFPGYAAFLHKEGFKMAQPNLFGQWSCPDNDIMTVQIGPGYGLAARRNPRPFLEKGVTITNATNSALQNMGAQVGYCGGYELGAFLYTSAGPMRLRLKDGMPDRPQYADRRNPDEAHRIGRARPGKLELMAKVAKHVMDSLSDPRWFEAFQDRDAFMRPLGMKGFGPHSSQALRSTLDWNREEIVLRVEFSAIDRNPNLLDVKGNLHLNVSASSMRIQNPVLEKAGLKTVQLINTLVAGFKAGKTVYVVRYEFPRRSLARSPATTFDAKRLAQFNRIVLGLHKLAAKASPSASAR